jgi:hypothetical protein
MVINSFLDNNAFCSKYKLVNIRYRIESFDVHSNCPLQAIASMADNVNITERNDIPSTKLPQTWARRKPRPCNGWASKQPQSSWKCHLATNHYLEKNHLEGHEYLCSLDTLL